MAITAVEIRISDRFGNVAEFESVKRLKRFIEGEQDEWDWLATAPRTPVDMQQNFLNYFTAALNWINQYENSAMDLQTLQNNVARLYIGDTPNLLMSDHAPGSSVSLIANALGPEVAVRSLVFLTGKAAPSLTRLEDFQAWQLLANPALIKASGWLENQKRQIGNARQALRREIDKYSEKTAELQRTIEAANREDRRRYRRLATLGIGWAKRRANTIQARAERQIELIQDTRLAYAEQMRLKAPVAYWETKGSAHRASAEKWGGALVVYGLVLVIAAIVGLPELWSAAELDGGLSGRHFLLVAGVGALLTLVFWIARLLVRIYLGERHLATDAEERRVMTQAYLALIKESAATDEERVVILSALFRTSQDGIVKDDGAGDISLPAMVARLVEARR